MNTDTCKLDPQTCGRGVLLSERDIKRTETHTAGLRRILPFPGRWRA